jgi:geranylgeranyl pyrophosphate synthase
LRRLAVAWGLFYQGVDDLTDILASARLSGKTAGRDESLGRPNIARRLGIAGAGRYLDRLIGISEDSVARLAAIRPGLKFLTRFQRLVARRRDALPIP